MRYGFIEDVPTIPDSLPELLGFSVDCPCGEIHGVDLKSVAIGNGVLDQLVDFVASVGRGLSIGIVADRVTNKIAGNHVAQLLTRAGHRIEHCIVPDGVGHRPHADDPSLSRVESALDRRDLAIAVGSGTINDLTKLASFNCKLPYMVVATAPSMNGYTSSIAAIMRRGIKRTIPCHQPLGLVADLDILCRAPHELIAAGLGDLESKPTATADYRLAGIMRQTYYCPAPERVVFAAEKRAVEAAEGLRHRSPEAIAALTEALILSGISMKLAGTSGPASGGEHLISHYWDMTAEAENRIEGWHGAQVGVATIVTATLYEYLQEMDVLDIDIDALIARRPSVETIQRRLKANHGVHADEVIAEYLSKRLEDDAYADELDRIKYGWQNIWTPLQHTLRPASQIRKTLAAAGAPTTVAQLGLSADHLHRALARANEIRGRYTVLDLAESIEVLENNGDEILRQSRCV